MTKVDQGAPVAGAVQTPNPAIKAQKMMADKDPMVYLITFEHTVEVA